MHSEGENSLTICTGRKPCKQTTQPRTVDIYSQRKRLLANCQVSRSGRHRGLQMTAERPARHSTLPQSPGGRKSMCNHQLEPDAGNPQACPGWNWNGKTCPPNNLLHDMMGREQRRAEVVGQTGQTLGGIYALSAKGSRCREQYLLWELVRRSR